MMIVEQNRLRHMACIVAGFLVLCDGAPWAEEPVVELPPQIVVASPFLGPLDLALNPDRAPLSLSDLSADLLQRQNAIVLREAVGNSAGVVTGTGNGVHDFFVIRGIDSLNGSAVLIDGIAEPESIFYPLHHIASVQVLKGPGSFAYGGTALAGAVNLVRYRPGPDIRPSLRLGLGSHDEMRVEGVLGAWEEHPNVGIRIDGLYRERGSHRDGIDHELSSVNVSGVWFPSEWDTLRVMVDRLDSSSIPDAGVPTLGDRLLSDARSLTFQEPGDFSDQVLSRVVFQWERELKQGVQLRNRAYYTQLDWDSRGTIYAGFVLAGLGLEPLPMTLSRYRPVLVDDQQILGNEIELRWSGDVGDIQHEALLGAEVQQLRDQFTLAIPTALDINVGTREQTPGILVPLPTNAGDATTDILSLYALDQIELTPTCSVLAGGRVDRLDFEDDAQGTDRSDNVFSPFVGVVVELAESLSAYGNVGRGFNPPSTQIVGPRGEPEVSEQIEGGVRWSIPESGWASLFSVYALDRENIAIPNSTGLTRAEGEQSSRGMEIEMEGPVFDRVTVRLAYGYLDSHLERFTEFLGQNLVDRSGNTAPFSPDHVGQAWLEWRPRDPWVLGLGVRTVDDQFIAVDNVYTIESYATLDAMLEYSVDDWSASLHVENLTDEYVLGRGQGSVSVIPEDGISAFGVVEVRL